jgi:DNA-binding response OmpR family regulator
MPTVLLVDDHRNLLETVAYSLRRRGYSVIACTDLSSAMVEASTSQFDVLLTDKNMDYHRGVEPLLNYMRSEKEFVPVIIFSAEDGIQARRELYCHDFINKSQPFEEFIKKIQNSFQRLGVI